MADRQPSSEHIEVELRRMCKLRLMYQGQIVVSVGKFVVDCALVKLLLAYRSKVLAHYVEGVCVGSSNDPPFSVRRYPTSNTLDCATPFF